MFSKCIVVVDEELDQSNRLANFASKMGIDATRKWPEEGFTRPWPGVIEMSPEIKRRCPHAKMRISPRWV